MNAKRQLCMVAGIILVLMLSACGGSASNGPTTSNGKIQLKIMVGGISKQIYLPNMLTQRLGYFSQEGLDVTLLDEASGQSSEDEVLAGQVDAGSWSYNHTIELQAAGKQMECVVQLDIAPGEAEIVSSKEASQIHSVSDLIGVFLSILAGMLARAYPASLFSRAFQCTRLTVRAFPAVIGGPHVDKHRNASSARPHCEHRASPSRRERPHLRQQGPEERL